MKSRKRKAPSQPRVKRELRKLGKSLDGLIAKTKEAEARARREYAVQLKVLRKKQAEGKKALAKLGRQSAAASGPLKAGLVKAWSNVSAAVTEARRRFRETS